MQNLLPHVLSGRLSVVACKKHVNKKIFTTFLIATMLCCLGGVLLPNDASARIRDLTDWLAHKDNMGFYVGPDGSQHSTTTCASLKGSNTKPNYKNCSSQTINGKVCYYNCTCPSSYSQTCTSPMVGSDGPCNGKYVSCSCPATYTLTCSDAGQAPSGSPCNGKYAACKCDSSWVSCTEGLGNGSACTHNGVKYYASCKTGESGNGAHYDEDGGELIVPPNDYTYFKGPLFDGKENTDAILNAAEAIGFTSPVVKYTRDFYVGSEDHENFGMGKWYLPALGEAMEMYGAEWKRLVYELKDGAIATVEKLKTALNEGGVFWSDDFINENNIEKIREAENKLEAMGVEDLARLDDNPFWTSNVIDAFVGGGDSYGAYVMAHNTVEVAPQSAEHPVLPVTMLEIPIIDGILPKVGDVITLDLKYGEVEKFDDPKDIAGIIYWRMRQPGETVRVRVRALTLAIGEHTVFNEGEENFAVKEVPDEPLTGVNLSDASLCDAKFKWTEANCTKALNGKLGGEICDLDGEKKFTECITACPVMNDYEQFTGPLFDGMTNTQLMKEVYSSNPAIEILDWQPDWAGELHEQLQAGHWYIPSLGEALTMTGCDDISAFGGSLSSIIDVDYSGKCDFDKGSEFRDRITVAADGMHENYLDYDIPTSQEISTEVFIGCGIGGCGHNPKNDPIAVWTVAALVEGDFAGAEYGDYLYADLHFSKDMEDDKYIGLIYWVAPDGSKARVVSRYPYLINDGATWTGTGDVNSDALVDDPFECDTGNTGGATSCYYAYTSSNCLFPRELKGATCTKDGTTYHDMCSCLAEDNIATTFTGCEVVRDSIGYNNTQKMLAAGSQAAEYATNYHPSGIADNHPLFGAGNWFITAGTESPYLARGLAPAGLGYLDNYFSYGACLLNNTMNSSIISKRFLTSCDTSETTIKSQEPRGFLSDNLEKNKRYFVHPVLHLKCENAGVPAGNILYSDLSYGYSPSKVPIGYVVYIRSPDSYTYLTIIALDYGENLTWSDDMSAKITDECGTY